MQATWISPIFKSPMVDFGYDISDYYDIEPEYGSLADFDNLIKRANELDIKILLDFVPNHSSDKHDWFVRSVNKEPGFKDWYIWHRGYVDPKNSSNLLPPNNWLSIGGGSAWAYNDKRKEFYYHVFAPSQADMNFRNPLVVNEFKVSRTTIRELGRLGILCAKLPMRLCVCKKKINNKYL